MNILYNYLEESSFISQDRQILSKSFNIINFKFNSKIKIFTPFVLILQLFSIVIKFNRYKIIVSQFAAYHTFIPSLLSALRLKKHYIVLHGSDCNSIPDLGYGNMTRPILSWFTKFSLKHASLLLPVSESLIFQKNSYIKDEPMIMGLYSHPYFKNLKYEVIHNGLDTSKFYNKNQARPPKSFITITSGAENYKRMKLKGIDLIINVAANNPEYTFTILGSKKIYNYTGELTNIKIISSVKNDELVHHLNNHKYYLQLSMSEGFGVALCEAMLCGCIPIVSNVGEMPKIIGDTGYVLGKRQDQLLHKLLKEIIKDKNEIKSTSAADRIKSKYNIELRENALLKIIKA